MLLQEQLSNIVKEKNRIKEKTHSILGTISYATFGEKDKHKYIMAGITDEEESIIDSNNYYIYFKKIIKDKAIKCYGEFDAYSDKDLDFIEYLNIVPDKGFWLYSNFDYDSGTFITIDGRLKGYTSYNPIDIFLYNHCLIGKPKKIIIFEL